MANLRPTLGHYWAGSLIHPMLLTAFLNILPERPREPRNEARFPSPAERLVGFESGIFWFWLQRHNPPDHSPRIGSILHK